MKLCSMCNQPSFGKDRNTNTPFCKSHQYMRTDLDKRSIAEKGLEKARKRKDIVEDESLKNLEEDLVAVHSLFIRLREADRNGNTECFVCHRPLHYKEAHNSHFINRTHRATRYSDDNCHVSCPSCNNLHNKNKEPYIAALEQWKKGIVAFLEEVSKEVVNFTRDDIRQMLFDYRKRVELIQRKLIV